MKKIFVASVFLISSGTSMVVVAETTATSVKKSTQEMGRDVSKNAKKAGRSLKDKTCEMVNGKLECAADRVKHGAQNAVDEAKDKADDVH